jgi:hypothetical protein
MESNLLVEVVLREFLGTNVRGMKNFHPELRKNL